MSNLSGATSASTSSFVTSLVFNSAVFAAEIVAFTLLRRYFKLIYEPRSLSVLDYKRQSPLPSHILAWPLAVFKADYRQIKNINGLDAYFFVRFLRMMVRVLIPIWFISWAILLPVTSVNTSVSNHSGLDKFTLGNVSPQDQARYWAHLVVAWAFAIWICWNIKHEMAHFIRVRQHFLVSPAHSALPQASTILVTGIPTKYLSEAALHKLFSHLPGGVRMVWLNRNLKEMPDLYKRRQAACKKLESAETALLSLATKRHKKNLKKVAKVNKTSDTSSSVGLTQRRNSDPEPLRTLAEELVPAKKRPTHRLRPFSWLPFGLPLMGKKVDSIEWAREEIRTTNDLLSEKRKILAQDVAHTTEDEAKANPRTHQIHAGKLNISLPAVPISIPGMGARPEAEFENQTYPPANGAFVLFNQQIAAHMAAQSLTHHSPYRMADAGKYVEVSPEDVIWDNLSMNPYERRVRFVISWALTIGLIILWAFPVAFVGAVSNIKSLCTTYSWLAWLCSLGPTVTGIIQGVLPPVLLAILLALIPIVLRLLARFEGIPQRTGVELSLMDRFFIFEVINGFLVVTVSSGIIRALPGLVKDVSSAPTLLAQNLPLASTFFLTYIILQGLSGTAGGLLRAVPLVLYYVKLFLLASTPRSVYNIKYGAVTSNWGTLFPQTTLLVVITLGYSVISPIINGLACATFALFYLLYKYIFTWVNDQPATSDTGGMFFPKALHHVFVGLYIQQICLAALFFLAQDENKHQSAIPEGALMVVLIVFTAFFHNLISNSYGPLLSYLPLSLAERSYTQPNREPVTQQAPAQTSSLKEEDDVQVKDYVTKEGSTSAVPDAEVAPVNGKANGTAESFSEHGPKSRVSSPSPSVMPIDEDDTQMTDFSHPAAVEPQRVIWLPRDILGLVEDAERGIRAEGIEMTCEGAEMDAKGHVNVKTAPPEEKKKGGLARETGAHDGEGEESDTRGWKLRKSERKA